MSEVKYIKCDCCGAETSDMCAENGWISIFAYNSTVYITESGGRDMKGQAKTRVYFTTDTPIHFCSLRCFNGFMVNEEISSKISGGGKID